MDGPDNERSVPPDWLLESISKVAITLKPTSAAPPFQFSSYDASVTYNTKLLRANDFNLIKIIE